MFEIRSHPVRVAIVGAGNVGSTVAYALLMSGLSAEIVLIDANQSKAEGEAMDLNHAVPLTHPTKIRVGSLSDCAGAAVTVIAAGAGQKPGESRLDLVKRNADIFSAIVPEAAKHNPTGILLVTTNPVDVLTYHSWKISGLPEKQVIGSGTILDTARFRYLLSQHFDVDARSVHAYIIGEHGDSEVPVWSLANIAGMRLEEFCRTNGCPFDVAAMNDIFKKTRDAAYEIIKRKGATYYAVAAGIIRIVEAILRDQRTVLTVSTLIRNYNGLDDVCLSLPTVVDRGGVEGFLRLDLNESERSALAISAQVLKRTIAGL